MLTELTPQQIELMYQVRAEWLDTFFSLHFDEQKAREFITFIYTELLHLPVPIIIIVDSPLGAQYAANYLKAGDQVGAQVWAQVGAQVGAQVRDQVRAQVWDQVGDQVGAQVWDQVGDQVRDQVWAQVGAQVGDQVGDQVRAQVRDQVRAQVRDQVRAQVRDQVWAQVGDQVWDQVGDQVGAQVGAHELFYFCNYCNVYDYDWVPFYDFFARISVFNHPLFNKYSLFLRESGIFMLITLKSLCIISRPPLKCVRDAHHRLHNIEAPAIAFRDRYFLHFVHGVAFKPELFTKFFAGRKVSLKEILTVRNIEQRAAIIAVYGMDDILRRIRKKNILDKVTLKAGGSEQVNYILFEYTVRGVAILRIIQVEDWSTHKKTLLCVPRLPETVTCQGAIAWTFSLSPKQYAPCKES